MPKQLIDRGTIANDGTGDTIRVGAGKVNDNFNEIYNAIGDGSTLISGTIISDISTATLSNKTINSNANTITIALGEITLTGTTTQFNSALSDDDFVALTNSVTLTNKTIDGGNNTLQNIPNSALDTIANAKLANSSISIGGVTFNLGDTDATPALDLSDATNYPTSSLSGTITNAQLDGSIANAKLSNSSITLRDDSSTTDAVSLGETLVMTGGTGITSVVGSNQVTFNIDSTVATLTGSQTLTNKTINGPDNTITNLANSNLSGSAAISNANLANSSITLGADSISLGASTSTITDLNLDGSSSISGTGTIDTTGSGNKLRFNVNYTDAAALGSAIDPSTYEGMFAYNTGETPNRAYYADAGGWVKLLDENTTITQISGVFTTGIADNYMLKWDSGQARFESVPLPIQSAAEFDVTNNGASNYLFDSHYSGANPTIYLIGGHTYAFNLNVSGHPFHIQTTSGAYSSGNAYSTGMTHIADDGTVSTGSNALLKQDGILYWKVPASISGNYYYVCQYHSAMAGTISIINVTTL